MGGELSAKQLEDLPRGSVVVRNGAEAFICDDVRYHNVKRLWGTSQSAGSFTSEWIAAGGAELVWSPGAAA
jgi:hypothetical protein